MIEQPRMKNNIFWKLNKSNWSTLRIVYIQHLCCFPMVPDSCKFFKSVCRGSWSSEFDFKEKNPTGNSYSLICLALSVAIVILFSPFSFNLKIQVPLGKSLISFSASLLDSIGMFAIDLALGLGDSGRAGLFFFFLWLPVGLSTNLMRDEEGGDFFE